MKAFLVWCVVFFGLYAGLSWAYHVYLTRHPRKSTGGGRYFLSYAHRLVASA